MNRRKIQWIIVSGIALFILLIGFHVISFVMIRSQANKDYELVRSGESLNRADLDDYPLTDSGSVMWEGTGYRVFRLRRVGDFAESRVDSEILVGAQLEFTCRSRFPIMQRWLKDREDSKIVVGPKAVREYMYTPPKTGH